MRKYLKDNGLLAVPFNKGVGFCIMRKQTYESKLESLLQSAQFVKEDATTEEIILKIEKECDIRPEWIKMQIQQIRKFSSKPSELTVLSD